MEHATIATATHTLMLDHAAGIGLAFDPDPAHDVRLGGQSLHEAGWHDIVERAYLAGFVPVEDENGDAEAFGVLQHGGEVIKFEMMVHPAEGDGLTDYTGTMADVEAAKRAFQG